MIKNSKAITGGLVTGIIMGIAGFVIAVIIALILTSTVEDANLLDAFRTTATTTGENLTYINSTGYQLASIDANYVPGTFNISVAMNMTKSARQRIHHNNWTISNTGSVTNATAEHWANVSITYSSSVYSTEEISTSDMTENFTRGIDHVSSKLPTILLIAAIVLILGVLVLLVAAWQRMRLSSGESKMYFFSLFFFFIFN